jgi:hypothetical protein
VSSALLTSKQTLSCLYYWAYPTCMHTKHFLASIHIYIKFKRNFIDFLKISFCAQNNFTQRTMQIQNFFIFIRNCFWGSVNFQKHKRKQCTDGPNHNSAEWLVHLLRFREVLDSRLARRPATVTEVFRGFAQPLQILYRSLSINHPKHLTLLTDWATYGFVKFTKNK